VGRRPGRPPIDGYRPQFALRAFKLGLLGLTNPELAERLEVSLATFERWISRHADLRAAVSDARDIADAEVANALRHLALGMTVEETKCFQHPRTGKYRAIGPAGLTHEDGTPVVYLRKPRLQGDEADHAQCR
jgi:hypothetical protein